jgi:hypothetical protein
VLRPHCDAALLAGLTLDQRRIEIAALEIAAQSHDEIASYVEPQARPGTDKIGEQRGEPVGGEILGNPQAYDGGPGRARNNVARFLGEREDPPGVGE